MARLDSLNRQPRFDTFDAEVGLGLDRRDPDWAYALVKQTYVFDGDGTARRSAPRALMGDPRIAKTALLPQSDFWTGKAGTDVVVEGAARAVDGHPFAEHEVLVGIGEQAHRIAVYGERRARWQRGSVIIEPGDLVSEVPLVPDFAYGGIDIRVPLAAPGERFQNAFAATAAVVSHPGRYPRNPFGMGYVCSPSEDREVPLPHLEDPSDLLDEARMVADPKQWWRQPLPRYTAFQHPLMFPRVADLGLNEAPLPRGAEELAEVERGWLTAERLIPDEWSPPHARCHAAPGLMFPDLRVDTPVRLRGVSADRTELSFRLPKPPSIEVGLAGDVSEVEVRMTSLRIFPDEMTFDVVYAAVRTELPKRYVKGVHSQIPLVAIVDGKHRLEYEAPPAWQRHADPFSRSEIR